MKNIFKNPFFYSSLIAVITLGLIISINNFYPVTQKVFGWTTPSTPPPGGNITLTSSQWTTNGSNIYYNSGNVGIGTTEPDSKLQVYTSGGADGSGLLVGSAKGSLNIWGGANSGLVMDVRNGTRAGSAGNLYIRAGGTDTLFIKSNGNVGIGTTTPAVKLDVNGVLRVGGFSSAPTGANGSLYYNTASNKFQGYQNGSWSDLGGSSVWLLNGTSTYYNSGNVGIGISTPNRTFDLIGDLSANGQLISNQKGGLYFGRSRISENQLVLNPNSFGLNWTAQTGAGSRNWYSVSLSSDGKYQTAAAYNGYLYTSSDYGATWTAQTGAGSRNWRSVSLSSDGKYQTAGDHTPGYLYTSSDYGATWTAQTGAGSRWWYKVSLSSDGKYQTAAANGNYLYTSYTDSYLPGGNLGINTSAPNTVLTVNGPISLNKPSTITTSYTLTTTDSSLICNGSASITLTLPTASSYPGRMLYVKTIKAYTVVSASSNVAPLNSSTPGTAILSATAGKWALLQSDGTNWVIMAAN